MKQYDIKMREKLIDMYCGRKMSMRDIATELKLPLSWVCNTMNELGVKSRTNKASTKLKWKQRNEKNV